MQEIGKFIDFLGQDSIREAIPVITAIGGALVVVLRFIFKVIYAQNMNEIDKVFMNRKQRTNLKLIDLFMVAIVLGLVNIILMLIRDDATDFLLVLGFIAAFFLILIYLIYKIAHFIWCKYKKTDKKWKLHRYMEEMLFVSEFLIGVEIGSLHTTILRGWKGILFCLIAASATSFLMVISVGFFEDGPSKVYFYIKGGRRMYIFYKLEDDILLCGDNKNIKKAKIRLIPFGNFKKSYHKLIIEKSNNQN